LSGLAESLKPSALLGLLGSEFSAPIIGMIGSKLGAVEDFVSSSLKNAFQIESKEDAAAAREIKSNEIALQIAENTGKMADVDEEGSSILDMLKNPGKALGTIISGLSGGLVGGLIGKSGSIIGTLFKGLGKMALPIALLFGAKDFIKGFKDVEKIAGTTNVIDAVEAGIAQLVSGLTFGLISPKKIYKVIDFIEEQFKNIIRAPFVLLRGILDGNVDLDVLVVDYISTVLSGFTLGFLSKDKIKNAITYITDHLINIFNTPFKFIQDLFNSDDSILTIIKRNASDLLNSFTFGIFSKENIDKSVNFVIEKFKMLLNHPIILLQEMIDSFMNFLEIPSFDITGTADDIANKVSEYFDGLIGSLRDFVQQIKDKITDKVDSIKSFFEFNLLNLAKGDLPEDGAADPIVDEINKKPSMASKDDIFHKIKSPSPKEIKTTFDDNYALFHANDKDKKLIKTNTNQTKIIDKYDQLTSKRRQITQQVKPDNTANIATITNNNTYQSNRSTDVNLLDVNAALF
jgi:hypothetical protein